MNDDIRKTNYSGWRRSGMVILTLLYRGIFNIQQYTKYEWCTDRDRPTLLGRGRVVWIKTVTVSRRKVNIVNVYQTTSTSQEQEEKLYDTLVKSLSTTV